MKKVLLVLTSLLVLTGCQLLSPVPSHTAVIKLPNGQAIDIVNQQDCAITGVVLTYNTNGTYTFKMSSLVSTNNPLTINNSYTGAAVMLQQANGLVQTGAKLAGVVATATNSAAK